MRKSVLVVLVLLALAGCTQQQYGGGAEESTKSESTPQPPITPPAPPTGQTVPPPPVFDLVPEPPKIQTIDWVLSLTPLIEQMVTASHAARGSELMLDQIKNGTNGSLSALNATQALYSTLGVHSIFKVISMETVASAERAIGLSAEDNFGSRSKAIGLARYLEAKYVLYTTLTGNVKTPNIMMQLMLVQTGEILWSGNGTAQMTEM